MNPVIKELVRTELTKNQILALESFVQDRGEEIFKNSNLLKVINRNDFDSVPAELAKWVVNQGRHSAELAELRQKEIILFSK
jgi:lysozyme